MAIKNYIFDLGGVLYQLDFETFVQKMSALQQGEGVPPFAYSRLDQPEVLSEYERGGISTRFFRDRLRDDYGIVARNATFDAAWNSILVGLYPDREALIATLKPQYRLALLSNINELHLVAIEEECQGLFGQFDQCFFSCLLGHRKPEADIFYEVLDNMNFLPEETVFIDDSPANVVAAQELGIQGILLENPDQLAAILDGNRDN